MGGGSEVEWVEVEELEMVAANVFQLCDSVAYGISLKGERETLEEEYRRLDALLASLGDSLPFMVANCAAHVTASHRLRKLALRYKEVEITTYGNLEGARRLGKGVLDILLAPSPFLSEEGEEVGKRTRAVVHALSMPAPCGLRQALKLLVERMQIVAQLLKATAAAHRAVSRDVDLVVAEASNMVNDPLKSDIGFQAAPIIGATAASSLGLILLRGALGPLGAVALGSLGALGAREVTQTQILPHVKDAFKRMYVEASQVSSLMDSKASSLDVIASDLMSASVLVDQLLDVSRHSGLKAGRQLEGPTEELHSVLSALVLHCQECQQRRTAFLALSYKLEPKGEPHSPLLSTLGKERKAGKEADPAKSL